MEPIIAPVDRELIELELTESKFLRNTNYGNRQIFVVTHHDSPNVMREIGRLMNTFVLETENVYSLVKAIR